MGCPDSKDVPGGQNKPLGPSSEVDRLEKGGFLRYQSLPTAAIAHIISQIPLKDALDLLVTSPFRSRAVEIIQQALLGVRKLDSAFIEELLALKKKAIATDAPIELNSLWADLNAASWPDLKATHFCPNSDLTLEDILVVISKCPGLRNLDLSEYLKTTDDMLVKVAGMCPHLQFLDVSHSQITGAGVAEVAKRCKDFRTLRLSHCKYFTDAWLSEIAKNGRGIEELYLGFCYQITDVGITEIARHCRGLRAIALTGCDYVTDVGVEEVAKHCENLQIFYPSYTFQITDRGISEVVKRCKNIERITLPGYRVTDVGASEVAHNCKKLTTLNIMGTRITDTGIAELARGCNNLEYLALITSPKITDAGLIEVAKLCKNLRTLKLCFACHITDHGITEVVKHGKELTGLILRDTRITKGMVAQLGGLIKSVQESI